MKKIVVQGAGFVGSAFAVACASAKNKNKYIFEVSIVEQEHQSELIGKINKGIFPFKTNDKKHPGFKHFLNTNEYFIHAKIFDFNKKIMKKINFTNPNYIKNIILKKKIKTIAGFHTRNVPHKGHEWIHSFGLSKCDSLLVQPMIGQFRKNEYKDKFILKTNQYLINNVYKRKNVFFGLYNSYPKYGGPREALLHAIVRRNFGCSHFLIGRDHAGVKNYYKKYE